MKQQKPNGFRKRGPTAKFDKREKPSFGKREKPSFDNRAKKPDFEKREKPAFDKRGPDKREKPAFEKREKPAFEKRREPHGASQRLSGPLLWGFHAVRAAWLNPERRILRLLVSDSGLEGFKDTIDAGTLKRPAPEIIDKGAFERMMPPGAVHQGIAALVESLPVRDAHDLIAGLKDGEAATIVILDQVTDPHNVGAILRSAAAFGARGVIMQDRHAPEMGGVLAKTASGAADVIPVAVETNLSRAIELLQAHEFFVIGLDERGEPLKDLPQYNRVALVLGAEGDGIRQNVANHCDGLASLPTAGPIMSLNVSNAAAVALYALKTK